ncbi:MAG: STAS domain-containing protein [Pseudomonas sp.]|uniref:STAS domain-containing protein n=1 Tax=Pseudomonas sp. TaxID=306 RepID=UPI0027207DE7|nr:STAS domain-containing protein [Pseudomonas sp.]MDO9618628.1 STAS domain-containing protein [Pseudomonas sp.]MDP2444375.1 STAS domain-containing protein [Pseudomonas sp.]MDZ4333270.1 STAS domain-containing protein [Pseudomonas sp.]
MSQASISEASPGVFSLVGVLDYLSVPALREQGARLLKVSPAAACVLDCAGVEKSSSVGLALLLAFMRDANAAGKSLSVSNLPKDMREIAGVCGLLEILPLQV